MLDLSAEAARELGLQFIEFTIGELYVPNQEAIDIVNKSSQKGRLETWYRTQQFLLTDNNRNDYWLLGDNIYRLDGASQSFACTAYPAYMFLGIATHKDPEKYNRNLFYCGEKFIVFNQLDMDTIFLKEKT